MPVFRVTSKTVQPSGGPTRSVIRANWWRDFLLRLLVAGVIISVLATLLPRFGLSVLFFLLLPVIVSVLTAYPHHYGRKVLLFRACLAFLYFSGITGWELLTHNSTVAEYIVVTTTLTLAVMFEPLRTYVQTFMEQRFHLSDDASIKAIEAFTSTLREEIDLNKVRDGLLVVVQQTIQPQAVSVWIRKGTGQDVKSLPPHNGLGENDLQTQGERYEQRMQEPPDGTSLIDFLLNELKSFTGEGWEQEDDVTLVTLQRAISSEQCHDDSVRYALSAGQSSQ